MLKTTSKTGKDAFSIRFDDLNENCLSELSSNEASEITGGFTVINDSGATKGFYNFGALVPAQAEVLQPGETASYNGEYILYNSSTTQFQPTLSQPLNPTDTVSFRLQGNKVVVKNAATTGGIIFSAVVAAPPGGM